MKAETEKYDVWRFGPSRPTRMGVRTRANGCHLPATHVSGESPRRPWLPILLKQSPFISPQPLPGRRLCLGPGLWAALHLGHFVQSQANRHHGPGRKHTLRPPHVSSQPMAFGYVIRPGKLTHVKLFARRATAIAQGTAHVFIDNRTLCRTYFPAPPPTKVDQQPSSSLRGAPTS